MDDKAQSKDPWDEVVDKQMDTQKSTCLKSLGAQ